MPSGCKQPIAGICCSLCPDLYAANPSEAHRHPAQLPLDPHLWRLAEPWQRPVTSWAPADASASCKRQQTVGRRASEQAQGVQERRARLRGGLPTHSPTPCWGPFVVERQAQLDAWTSMLRTHGARTELRLLAQGYRICRFQERCL